MAATSPILVDYSAGLSPGQFPGVRVILADESRRARGDAPTRSAFLAAFGEAARAGAGPAICLTGPYGDSPAFTAASGARNDLARLDLKPDLVRVLNTGRAFHGLGLLALLCARSRVGGQAASAWLDQLAPRVTMWLIASTAGLAAAPAALHLDLAGSLPDKPFTLLRIRLTARAVAGCESPSAAIAEAVALSSPSGPALALFSPGLGLDEPVMRSALDAALELAAQRSQAAAGGSQHEARSSLLAAASSELHSAPLPQLFATTLGDCAALAVAPLAT